MAKRKIAEADLQRSRQVMDNFIQPSSSTTAHTTTSTATDASAQSISPSSLPFFADNIVAKAQQPLTTSLQEIPVAYLESIPNAFHAKVKPILEQIRHSCYKSTATSWSMITSVQDGINHHWRSPQFSCEMPKPEDYLATHFCRLKFFIPHKQVPHLLPNGRVPCPWHGYDNSCVKYNTIFNPSGPRKVVDADGGLTYLFSSRYLCDIRKKSYETVECYYFLGHDERLLQFYPDSVVSMIGAVITKKRAISTQLYQLMMNRNQLCFSSLEREMRESAMHLYLSSELSYLNHLSEWKKSISAGFYPLSPQPFPKFVDIVDDFIDRR